MALRELPQADVQTLPRCARLECGLGGGPHWNYFSDLRLWNKLVALLRACPDHDYEAYHREIADDALDPQEQRELLALQVITGLSIVFAPLALLTTRTLYLSYLFAPDARLVLRPTLTTDLRYVLAAAVGIATLHIAAMLKVIFAAGYGRETGSGFAPSDSGASP